MNYEEALLWGLLSLVEDITMTTRIFHWPEDIKSVFDLSTTRLRHKRDGCEDVLKERVTKFEKA